MKTKKGQYGNRICLLIIILCQLFIAQAQNPPGLDWKCIKTKNFKVIFPSEIEAEAQRVANTLEWVYDKNTKSLHVKPKPVPLVLYSRSMTSNAYAGLAPRMMGWYMNPSQSVNNLGSVEWLQTLSIHEYRHIVQYAKNRRNFTKFMTILYGDMGQSMMRWTIPNWFFEGDAVLMETALTKGGRGRMPEFDMQIRSFAIENEKYTYDQAYLGSYKRFYPSHYHLGYPLTAYARINYGPEIWDKVLERTSKIPFLPFAFGGSLKKYTGLNVGKLYQKTMDDLAGKWKTESEQLKTIPLKKMNNREKKCWTNYTNPKYDGKGNIVCIKQSLKELPYFCLLSPDGKEEKIINTNAENFSLKNNIICREMTIPDPRWSEQSFSDVVLFGQKSKLSKRLTFKKKYQSPALSPDGKTIALVEHDPSQKNHLRLLDALTGAEIQSFEIGDNDYIRMPAWSEDGKSLVFTHSKFNGQALSTLDLEKGNLTKVLDYGFENIGQPVFYKQYILYNSTYSGISNIFAVDVTTHQKYQVTSSKFGASNADVSPDKSKMVFQDYQKAGYDIAEIQLNPETWIKIEDIHPTEQHYYKKLVEQEGGTCLSDSVVDQKIYPVTKYQKFKDGMKIHSWGLFPYDPFLEFIVYGDNYLNTLSAQAGYYYNTNEQTGTSYLGISYSKYFPVFTLTSSYGQRKDSYNLSTGVVEDSWDELSYNLNVSLPFNFSRNVNYTSLSVKGAYTLINSLKKADIRWLSDPPSGYMNVLSTGISFTNRTQYAWRDFNPRWAQYLNVDYKQIVGSGSTKGHLFSARSYLYFPGLFPQNSLKLGACFDKQLDFDENDYSHNYYFSNLTSFPRGYTSYTMDKIYKLSADYQLPLWYPDLSIGPLMYIKRIRAGVFFDYGKGYFGQNMSKYKSLGGSITLEFNIFRYKYPLEVGLQCAYKPQEQSTDISVLILGLPF
jgi:hypothetical protein